MSKSRKLRRMYDDCRTSVHLCTRRNATRIIFFFFLFVFCSQDNSSNVEKIRNTNEDASRHAEACKTRTRRRKVYFVLADGARFAGHRHHARIFNNEFCTFSIVLAAKPVTRDKKTAVPTERASIKPYGYDTRVFAKHIT